MTQYIYGNKLTLNSRNNNPVAIKSNEGLNIVSSRGGFYNSGVCAIGLFVQNEWTILGGDTTASLDLQDFTHANNKLTYTGTNPVNLLLMFSIFSIGSTINLYDFGVSINDEDPELSNYMGITIGATQTRPLYFSSMLTLNNGDYLSVYVRNTDGTGGIDIYKFILTVNEI